MKEKEAHIRLLSRQVEEKQNKDDQDVENFVAENISYSQYERQRYEKELQRIDFQEGKKTYWKV